MKKCYMIFLAGIFFSCNQSPTYQQQDKAETPKALQNETSDYSLGSKRSYEDLLEQLYQEEVNKTASLKALEKEIDESESIKSNSLKPLNEFNAKATTYYDAATKHLSAIRDSSLRENIRLIINKSQLKYSSQIEPLKSMEKLLQEESVKLNDAHEILKISTTLPLMEEYFKTSQPSLQSIKEALEKLEKTRLKTEKAGN